MWAAMGVVSDSKSGDIVGGVNTGGYTKAFAGSNGSNAIGDYAWNYENSGSKTHPVGSKLPNELGLYDMSGNVWQWCWDWWASSYPTGAQTNPTGASSGSNRVVRGGGWNSAASHCTVANRNSYYPTYQYDFVGFRVVRP